MLLAALEIGVSECGITQSESNQALEVLRRHQAPSPDLADRLAALVEHLDREYFDADEQGSPDAILLFRRARAAAGLSCALTASSPTEIAEAVYEAVHASDDAEATCARLVLICEREATA
jgi:hypothetical protein